jgi:pilus assembly protein Flp/PilA
MDSEEVMKGLMVRFVREDEGQDLIEYALLATVIALVVFVGASAAGTSLNTWYGNIGTTVSNWAANALK